MKKVTITLPNWIGQDEAQDMVVRDLRAHVLLKLEFYRSKMKPFEAKYATTFPRFQRRVEKAIQEEFRSLGRPHRVGSLLPELSGVEKALY